MCVVFSTGTQILSAAEHSCPLRGQVLYRLPTASLLTCGEAVAAALDFVFWLILLTGP